MAPKAKAKMAAAGKAKAKPGAAPKAKPKAVMRAKAKPKAAMRRRVRGIGALRRPAAEERRREVPKSSREAWDSGHTVRASEMSLDWVVQDKKIVVEEALYFHRQCKVAGLLLGTTMAEGRVTLRIQPTGTTDEGLLKLQSGNPQQELRLVLCPADCNHEEVSEDLIHAVRLRKRRADPSEEAWVDNLEKVIPAEEGDELAKLRGLLRHPGGEAEQGGKPEEKTKKEKEKDKKREKEKEKRKKKKKEKKKRTTSSTSEATSTGKAALDGTKPKQSSQKTAKSLFQGTGMDPSEKVRNKVSRMAKRYVRKKGKKSSSGSDSDRASSQAVSPDEEGDSVFQQAARVRGIAEAYPGVLSCQAISQMRSNLLQGLGEEEKGAGVPAVSVMYYRQVLQKKASGGVARELLSLCAIADQLIKARPAQALDIALQRLKSAESTLNGTHWSVSQRLELLPQEQSTLTSVSEMKEAQKETWEESRTRWLSSQPDGRATSGQKGGGKPKGGSKEDNRKGDWRRDGKGKGTSGKGDGKRKDEAGNKPS